MRAALYARYSSDLQSDASIADQLRLCRERAAAMPASVAEVYSDAAISGAAVGNRPGLRMLLEDARAGRFDVVIAEALDRLSRGQADIAFIFERLGHAGIRIVTLAEGDVSELHIGLKGTMNALFLKDLAAKIRRGQRGRVEAARFPGGLPYGYDVDRSAGADGEIDPGRRGVNPAEAAVVARVFKDFAAGVATRAIAGALNAEGVPSPAGGHWNASTINGSRSRASGILHNEIYLGRLVHNRQTFRKDPETGRRVGRLNPRSEWKTVEIPALRIVDDAVWQAVQARLAEYGGARTMVRARRPRHLFSGLVVCHSCGRPYIVDGAVYLRCSGNRESRNCPNGHKVRREDLERRVLDGLRDKLLSAEAFALAVKVYREERARLGADDARRRREAEKERAEVERQIGRAVDAICQGTDTPAIRQKLKDMEARKLAIAASREAAAPGPNVVDLHPQLPEAYRRKVVDLEAALKRSPADRAVATEALRAIVERVVVGPGARRGESLVELHGSIPGVLAFAARPADAPGPRRAPAHRLVLLVAEERFSRYPPSERLVVRC